LRFELRRGWRAGTHVKPSTSRISAGDNVQDFKRRAHIIPHQPVAERAGMTATALFWADFNLLASTSSMWRDLALAMMSVNHGGLVVCTATDVHLSSITVDFQITMFELLCTRVTAGGFVSVIIVVYSTGTVSSKFLTSWLV
jgi:hypothetical protein